MDNFPGPRHNHFDLSSWDDFQEGETWEFGSHEVTAEEIIAFAEKYDPEPFHVSEELAKDTVMGELISSGIQMAAWLRGMHCRAMPDLGWSLSPGWEDVRFLNPVRPGDVLSVRLKCAAARPSNSRPEWGIINYEGELVNQAGEVKLATKPIVFYRRRDAA